MSEKIFSSLGERLAEERGRLGLDQSTLADLLGKSRRTISAWEHDEQSPPASVLIAMAAHGLDHLYVLTGQRGLHTVGALTAEESAVLDNYRHATEAGRAAARSVLYAVEKSAPPRPRRKAAGGESD